MANSVSQAGGKNTAEGLAFGNWIKLRQQLYELVATF